MENIFRQSELKIQFLYQDHANEECEPREVRPAVHQGQGRRQDEQDVHQGRDHLHRTYCEHSLSTDEPRDKGDTSMKTHKLMDRECLGASKKHEQQENSMNVTE